MKTKTFGISAILNQSIIMTPLKSISERKALRGDPKFPFGSLALASVRSAKECLPAVANIWSVWSYDRAAVRSKKDTG